MLGTRVAVLSVAALGALLLASYGSAMAQEEEPGQEEGPPVVVHTGPADGGKRVERDVFIGVNFSEEMREGSIKVRTVRLYEGDKPVPAKQVPAAYVAYYSVGRGTNFLASLKPKRLLKPKTEYTVVVEGAADDDGKAVKDFDGTPMAEDYTFSFTTGKR